MGASRDVAVAVRELPASGALAAAKAIKAIAAREAAKVAGPDQRLSHVGRRGAKLTTRDTFGRVQGARSQITIYAVPPAPWSWVTDGTRAHVIGAGRASRRSGNYAQAGFTTKRKVISFGPDEAVYGPVFHPGQVGQQAWTKVRVTSRRVVPAIFQKELHRLMG